MAAVSESNLIFTSPCYATSASRKDTAWDDEFTNAARPDAARNSLRGHIWVWLGGASDSHAQSRYTPVAERCYMLALTVSEIAQEDRLM